MSEWFFRKKSKGEVERDPGWDEYFTSNRSTDDQAVKCNANRFPEGFRFQLSKEENEVLISQIVTSKRNAGQETRGGYHKLPYAFTLSSSTVPRYMQSVHR